MDAESKVSEEARDNSKNVIQSTKHEGDENNDAQKSTEVADKRIVSDGGNKNDLKPSQVNSSAKQNNDENSNKKNSNKENSRKTEIHATDNSTVVEDKVNLLNENESRNNTETESNASEDISLCLIEGALKAENNDGRQSIENKSNHEEEHSNRGSKHSVGETNSSTTSKQTNNVVANSNSVCENKLEDDNVIKDSVIENSELSSASSNLTNENSKTVTSKKEISTKGTKFDNEGSSGVAKSSLKSGGDPKDSLVHKSKHGDDSSNTIRGKISINESEVKQNLIDLAKLSNDDPTGVKEKSRNMGAKNDSSSNKNEHEAQSTDDFHKDSPEYENRTDIYTEENNECKPKTPNEKTRQIDESGAKKPLIEQAKLGSDETAGVEEKSRNTNAKNDSSSNKKEHETQSSNDVDKDSPEDDNRTGIYTEESNKNKPKTPSEKTRKKGEVNPTESSNETAAEIREEYKKSFETETKVIEDDNVSNKDRMSSEAQAENFVSPIDNDLKTSEENREKAEDIEENSQDPNNNKQGGRRVSKDNIDNENEAAYLVDVKGKGLRETVAGVVGHFIVVIKSEKNENNPVNSSEFKPVIKITSEQDNNSIEPIIIDNEDGTFKINYMIQNVEKHAIEIKIKDQDISGSPFTLNVIPLDIHNTTEILGLKSETYLGVEERFEIKLKQLGNEISNFLPEVQFQCTDQEKIIRPVFIEDNQDGSFTVSYLICEEGDFRVHVKIEDKDVRGSPFSVKVLSPTPFSTAEGKGLHEAFVGVPGNFVVTTRDAAGNSIYGPSCCPEIHITYPNQDGPVEPTKIEDKEDGSFVVHYNFVEPRTYKIEIKIYDAEIPRSPFELKVEMQEFTPLYEFGKEGVGEGILQKPWGVAVNSEDNVIVTDRSQNSIQVFTSCG